MNTADAAYHVVHDYPGGSESLGPRVDISAAVLRNKVNRNTPKAEKRHHLTLEEAIRITDMADDDRILQAWAQERGRVLIKPPAGIACDRAVLEQVVGLAVANGEFMATINEALADNKITPDEIERIREGENKVQAQAATVTGSLEGMAEK